MKPSKIFVFGNPRVKGDSIPLKILPELRKRFPRIQFIEEDPTEMLDQAGKELWILDTVQGIYDVKLIDFNRCVKLRHFGSGLGRTHRVSVHDYDLALDLKLLSKLGKVKKIKIIAIPQGMPKKESLKKVTELFRASGF